MCIGRWIAFATLLSLASLGHAFAGPGELLPERTTSADAKLSGAVKFVGSVGFSINNSSGTARIWFDELRNQNLTAPGTSGPLEVMFFVTPTYVGPGQSFSTYWRIASWDAPHTLLPGNSYLDIDVVRGLQTVPDGVYYAYLGAMEKGPGCGNQVYCYADYRNFPQRLQVTSGYWALYDPNSGIQPGNISQAVEFFHPGFGHYFLTAQADEITALDSGIFAGWSRTGANFNVWTSGIGLAEVCRFFTTYFAPKSSHFYTAIPYECELIKSNPVWQYEKLAFKVAEVAPGSRTGV